MINYFFSHYFCLGVLFDFLKCWLHVNPCIVLLCIHYFLNNFGYHTNYKNLLITLTCSCNAWSINLCQASCGFPQFSDKQPTNKSSSLIIGEPPPLTPDSTSLFCIKRSRVKIYLNVYDKDQMIFLQLLVLKKKTLWNILHSWLFYCMKIIVFCLFSSVVMLMQTYIKFHESCDDSNV